MTVYLLLILILRLGFESESMIVSLHLYYLSCSAEQREVCFCEPKKIKSLAILFE